MKSFESKITCDPVSVFREADVRIAFSCSPCDTLEEGALVVFPGDSPFKSTCGYVVSSFDLNENEKGVIIHRLNKDQNVWDASIDAYNNNRIIHFFSNANQDKK